MVRSGRRPSRIVSRGTIKPVACNRLITVYSEPNRILMLSSFRRFRRVGLGQVGEGSRGGGAGELHAELLQLRQHALVAREALGCVFRLDGGDGVQGLLTL